MAAKIYSDNQKTVDELAGRLAAQTSLDADKAKLVAFDLLCRKVLKIKSSALAQIFRAADKECDTKALRAELLDAQIITKIEQTGLKGRPAFYTINVVEAEDAEGGIEPEEAYEGAGVSESIVEEDTVEAADMDVSDAADEPAEGTAETEPARPAHVDTDETLDENVVRAFTSKVGRGFSGGGKRDAQRRAQQERFRRAVAEKNAQDADVAAADVDEACEEQKPAGKHWSKPVEKKTAEPKRPAADESAAEKPEADKPAVEKTASCKPGRGFAAERAPKAKKSVPEAVVADKPVEQVSDTQSVSSSDIAGPKPNEEKKRAPRRRNRKRSNAGEAVEAVRDAGEDVKPDSSRSAEKATQSENKAQQEKKADDAPVRKRSHRKQEGAGEKAEKPQKQVKSAPEKQVKEEQPAKDATSQDGSAKSAHADVSPIAIARVLGRRILKASKNSTALAKIREQQTQIVKVEKKDKKPAAPQRPAHNDMSNRKIAEDVATVTAWVERIRGLDVPFASRRQRAYEIFNDEKAFEGKRGERLVKRLAEKNISMLTMKIAPNKPVHFTGFFTLGADKPFIMVENLDTYDEIVKLLKGRKNAKLFGIKVGGVIFGGGCKASVSHALDDYLAEIGYRFNYVYYVGDIDREGARIVEQTRNANVTEIRLHAGMYKAMLAEHKRRVKDGGTCEPAAANQGVPQNLAATIKDLPMVTRVQFRNVLREGGRIPQEILMTADYRDGDSGSFDRIINK